MPSKGVGQDIGRDPPDRTGEFFVRADSFHCLVTFVVLVGLERQTKVRDQGGRSWTVESAGAAWESYIIRKAHKGGEV